MKPVGFAQHGIPLSTGPEKYVDKYCHYFKEYLINHKSPYIQENASYRRVKLNFDNIFTSIRKADVPRVEPPFHDPLFKVAIEYAYLYLHDSLYSEVAFDRVYEYGSDTSAGFPYTKMTEQHAKLNKKGKAIESDLYKDFMDREDYVPLSTVNGKDEFLQKSEIDGGKARTIFAVPLDLIMKTKFFFDAQNEKIVQNAEHSWIKYGFVKQYKGFDTLFKELEKFTDIFQGDLSGYDRTILLQLVYHLRGRGLNVKEFEPRLRHMYEWVVMHTVYPIIILPNGLVVQRQTGNNSGGNNTASDNSIAHLLIMFYFLIRIYYDAFEDIPTLDFITEESHVNIYSDDTLGGINLKSFGIHSSEEFIDKWIENYAIFGLTLKKNTVLVTHKPVGGRVDSRHEFLGSTAVYSPDVGYLPYPRVGKICSSILYEPIGGSLDLHNHFQKTLQLAELAFADGQMFNEIISYLKFLYSYDKSESYHLDVLMKEQNLSLTYTNSFLLKATGWECKIISSEEEVLKTSMNTNNPLDQSLELTKPTPAKAEASARVMNAMVSTGQLSSAGMAFLKLATDPWHDNKIDNFKGVPDFTMGNSVTCSVVQELNISKPLAVGAGNWKVRISTNPIGGAVKCTQYNFGRNAGDRIAGTDTTLWPIAVDFRPDGVDFPDFPGTDSTLYKGLELPLAYRQGPFKVAAVGVEVVNTTAALSQQGLATCSRMNQTTDRDFTAVLYNAPAGGNWDPLSVTPVRAPPKNLSEMLLLPDTTQWHAKEGAYAVAELLSVGTVPPSIEPRFPLVLSGDLGNGVAPALGPTLTNQVVGTQAALWLPGDNPGIVPMNSSIIMFSGLSDETTLTLRVRWIIERYPNDNQPEIVVLATPTASFDPIALELYARVMRKLPVAVMFKENNSQDWWKTVLAGLADIASSGLLMMPHPLAKGAGAALAGARMLLAPSAPPVRLTTGGKIKTTPKKAKEKPKTKPNKALG